MSRHAARHAAPMSRTDYRLLRAERALQGAALIAAGLWLATLQPLPLGI